MAESGESVVAYVGLGSNMGDSVAFLQAAKRSLAASTGIELLQCASFYKSAPVDTGYGGEPGGTGYSSAPVGTGEQPDFINSVCALATTLAAEDLLRRLMEIEQKFGRRRSGEVGEPRTLDLDMLLYSDQSIVTDQLTLPHPRLHERAFVLYPLSEIAPDLVIPGHGRVLDLLNNCKHQRITRLAGQESKPE